MDRKKGTYKVSIIIPVYNAESKLDRCIDSLRRQNVDCFQVIVVDDGSSDDSYFKLLQHKSLWGDRMILLQKENGGAASARNMALGYVNTPYIMFCDIDDYVEDDYVEMMLQAAEAEDADIVSCSYYIENKTEKKECLLDERIEYLSDNKDLICDTDVVLWNKIYRTSIFEDNNIKMPEGIIFEDNAVIPQIVSRSQKLVCINKMLYHYDVSMATSVMNHCKERIGDLLQVVHELHRDKMEQLYWEQYQFIYTELVFSYISNVVFDTKNEQKIAYAYSILKDYNVEIQNECFVRHMKTMNKNKRVVFWLILNNHFGALRCFFRIRDLKNKLICRNKG